MTAATPSAMSRLCLRPVACLSGKNSSWVRSPASVKTPAGKNPAAVPGVTSANASRKDREISTREGEANSATLAATAIPSPITPLPLPEAICTVP